MAENNVQVPPLRTCPASTFLLNYICLQPIIKQLYNVYNKDFSLSLSLSTFQSF